MAIVTSNLIYHFNAGLAKNGVSPGNNTDPTSSWYELVEGVNEGTLTGPFAYTTDDGWAGSGTNEDPYCLVNPSTHYVALAADSSLNPGNIFTIEIWYYAASIPGAAQYMYGNHLSNTGVSCYLHTTGNHQWRVGTGTTYVWPGNSVAGYGGWKMVSLRRTSGGVYYAYVNGASNGGGVTDAFSGNAGASRFMGVSGLAGLVGKVSALRIYNTDIGTGGIIQNYNEGPTEGLQGSPPTVTTDTVTEITTSTATSGGVITDEGSSAVTAYGVCWNTTGNPTTADDKTIDGP